jgi:hypothetical protein
VRTEFKLFNKVLNHGQILMLNSCEKGRVSIPVLDVKIKLKVFYQMFHDINITPGNSKMNGDLALTFLELVKHLLKRNVLGVDSSLFVEYFFLEIDKEKFKLSDFESCDCVDDVLKDSHDLLILFEVFAVHVIMK